MSKRDAYRELISELTSLLEGERDWVANAANTSALLFERMESLNWIGFYFLRGEELIVGPFQGRPACVRIALGKGVCGTSAARRETIVVPDVHAFPGHIACDAASNSEIVVPLFVADKVVGVLDADSPVLGRFDDDDRNGLEEIARVFVRATDLDGR
jgi:GAF domain-containing protein